MAGVTTCTSEVASVHLVERQASESFQASDLSNVGSHFHAFRSKVFLIDTQRLTPGNCVSYQSLVPVAVSTFC